MMPLQRTRLAGQVEPMRAMGLFEEVGQFGMVDVELDVMRSCLWG